MKSSHFFGIRLDDGKLARFSMPVRDAEFQALTAKGLPVGWVAWHIPDGENVDNSERCRELAKLPIVVLISGGLAGLEVPARGPIVSRFPTPHPGDVICGKFPGVKVQFEGALK